MCRVKPAGGAVQELSVVHLPRLGEVLQAVTVAVTVVHVGGSH
jgi:hypothetical protein